MFSKGSTKTDEKKQEISIPFKVPPSSLTNPSTKQLNGVLIVTQYIKKDNLTIVIDHLNDIEKKTKEKIDVLFIVSNTVTAASMHVLKTKLTTIKLFSPLHCLIRAELHKGQPTFRIVTRNECDILFGNTQHSNLKFARLQITDPIVQFYGYPVGTILEIRRPTFDGFSVEYRKVM
tara:strand:- start:2332 stop:2859 length:528 start_codon:yes stop_codon:yes gene_type:complete